MTDYIITAPDGRKFKVSGDGTRDEAMAQVQSQYQAPAEQPIEQQPESIYDRVMRQVGRTARIPLDAAAALPNMAMDAGVAVSNFARDRQDEYPSATYKREMDKILPPAEGITENVVDIAGQIMVGGKMIPNIGIKNPAPAVQTLRNTAQEAIKTGAKHDVPVYYDDVGGHISKKIGTATDQIPVVGTGGGRAGQQKAVNKAVERLSSKYYIDDDIPELVQKGTQDRLNSLRATAGKLYDKAGALLNPRGKIDTKNFDDVILEEMAKQEGMGTAGNKEVITILEKYASAPRKDFSFMRELRSQLGTEIDGFYGGGSAVGKAGVGPLQAVKNALEMDMAKFADDAGGAGKSAWRKADAFYRKGIIPFKTSGLKQLVKTDEPQKAWRYLVQQGAGKARAEKMYKALDPKGRATVRSGLIQDAIDFAKVEKTGDISPAKFAQYMEKHSNAIETFFKGADKKEVRGFQNLMRHVERAGQYAENPPTGNRLIAALLMGGAATVSAPTTAKVAGGTLLIKSLFQTKVGRDALIAASYYKPGSKQMTDVSRYIAATIATQSNKE